MDPQSRLAFDRIVGSDTARSRRSPAQHAETVEAVNAALRSGAIVLSPFDPAGPPHYFDGHTMHTWFVRAGAIYHRRTGPDGALLGDRRLGPS